MMETLEKPVVAETLEPDPLWDIAFTGRKMKKSERDLFFEGRDSVRQQCGAVGDSSTEENWVGNRGHWSCTRGPHPDHWRHISTGGYRGDIEMLAAWGGVNPAELAVNGDDVVPTDFVLEIGKIYKFKNRKTPLLYVGARKGGKVEVLDLEHEHYRVLKAEQLVPRPADAEPLTREQVRWVARFMAERREKTRTIALQQREQGRFPSRQELDKILKELKLEPTVTVLRGDFAISGKIRSTGAADQGAATKLMKEWFDSLPPLPPGLAFEGKANVDTSLRRREG